MHIHKTQKPQNPTLSSKHKGIGISIGNNLLMYLKKLIFRIANRKLTLKPRFSQELDIFGWGVLALKGDSFYIIPVNIEFVLLLHTGAVAIGCEGDSLGRDGSRSIRADTGSP
jgi:hypothetical protein